MPAELILAGKIGQTEPYPDCRSPDLKQGLDTLISEIEAISTDLNVLYTWVNPSRKIRKSADLTDFISRIPEHENKLWYFDILRQTSSLILKSVEYEELARLNNIQTDIASRMNTQTQRFDKRLNYKFESDSDIDNNSPYSNFEFILYRYLSSGANPWNLISQFEQNLTLAVQKNPKAFWRMFRSFRLDKIVPFFSKMPDEDKDKLSEVLQESGNETDDGIKVFCQALERMGLEDFETNPENFGEKWSQTFHLMPHIQSLMDEGVPFEKQNKPEIYMNIALALAYLSLELNSEPIAALVVKDGQVISGAHNEATKYKNFFIHAENIAIHNAIEATGDEILAGCSIYVTAESCTECSTQIMKHQFSDVYIGIATEMGGESQFGILTSPKLSRQGPPYRDPYKSKNIIWGVLEDELFHLYYNVTGWQDFVKPLPVFTLSVPLPQSV